MTFRGFIPRAEWGAAAPRSRSTNIRPVGSLAHWMGPRVGHISHGRCFDYVRGVQRFHMDRVNGRGWVDIAYSMLPCRHGYVFAGRGAGIRTAANGTNDANSRFHAIALLVGQDDTVTADAIDAMWWAWDALGRGHMGDHRDVRPTACPGPDIDRATDSPPPPEGTAMHNPIDTKAHSLVDIPDWAPWKEYLEQGGSTVPESGVWPASRADIAWASIEGPLAKRADQLEKTVTAQAKTIAALTKRIKALEDSEGTAGDGTVAEHRHTSDGTTGGVAR